MASLGELSLDVKANTGGFLSKMKGVAGSAGAAKAALAGVAAGAAAAMAGIAALGAAAFDTVKDIAALGDSAAKAAGRMGTTAEVVQELTHAAKLSGTTIEEVEKGFQRLGKDAAKAGGALKTTEQLFMEAADTIAAMTNETERVAFAQDTFGKSGAKLLPMLKAGSAGIAEMREEARELGIVMSNDAAATSERFNDTLDRLDAAFQGVKTTIGVAMLPAFTELFNVILTVTRSVLDSVPVAEYMQQALSGLTKAAISLIRGLSEIAPVISVMGTAIGVASNLGQIWMSGFFAIGKVIAGVSATILEFVTGALSGLIGAGADVAKALGYAGLAGALETAEKGIASVAAVAGGVGNAAFSSLGGTIDSVAGDIGDIDSLLSNLANGSTTSALRDTLGKIETGLENIGSASLDSAKDMETSAATMVKSARAIESALKDVALAHANAFLAEQEANRGAREKEVGRIGSGMGSAIAEVEAGQASHAAGRRENELAKGGQDTAALAAPAIEELGKQSKVAGGALDAFSAGPIVGLIKVFTQLWTESEEMKKVFALLDGVFEPFREFIDIIGKALMPVLKPIVGVFKALSPVIKAVLFVMNPFVLVLKVVGAAFKGIGKLLDVFAKPIKAVVVALRKFINGLRVFVHNLGRTRKSKKWDLDDEGNIVNRATGERVFGDKSPDREIEEANTSGNYEVADAADAAADSLNELAEAVPAHIKRMGDSMAAAAAGFAERMGVFTSPDAVFGMGSGKTEIWGSFQEQIEAARDGLADTAEAARDAAGAMLNVPQIFRGELRRGQAGGGAVSPQGGGLGGGVYIAGNVIVQGADIDATMRNLRRRQFTAFGETYTGLAAASALPAAG